MTSSTPAPRTGGTRTTWAATVITTAAVRATAVAAGPALATYSAEAN